jgi:CheY-like chemotaxis protein
MPPSILIVDDLSNWRRQLSAILVRRGYSVEVACTAQTEKRARKSPRCVGFIKKEEFDIRQFVAAVETSVGAPD